MRGIIYPLKDALATKDDEICAKTLHLILLLAKRSAKIAEEFVQYFHLILPNIEILQNMHSAFATSYLKSVKARAASATTKSGHRKIDGVLVPIKLEDLKRQKDIPDIGHLC